MQQLRDRAERIFGGPPEFVVRAPGRVNLIGEHTDYNGFPVMPMAIDREILIAGRARADTRVQLFNRGSFGERVFNVADHIAPFPAGDWGNYVKAAAVGLRLHAGSEFVAKGADLLVDGNVPDGAGLSSSAALVVASALALLSANRRELPATRLAAILPQAEQYVGTLSGGMDQTICLLARAHHALRIDFRPLRFRTVPLPADHVFVVAHSLVKADKSSGARHAYNQRVAECRLAAFVLARVWAADRDEDVRLLADLTSTLATTPGELAPMVRTALPAGALSLEQIAARIGSSVEELRIHAAVPNDSGPTYVLAERARHVFSEADRVDRAEASLTKHDTVAFGEWMNESHASCRDDYDISCPELETLIAAARDAGAVGSRLTGAGFGGCTVSLVPSAEVDRFLDELDGRFYASRGIRPTELAQLRFVLRPSSGADVTWA